MMKKINKLLSPNILWFLFFLLTSVIYFWPFLTHPAFNLIDDGVTLRVSKEIAAGDFNLIIETQNGRIRFCYWLYFAIIYLLSGMNPLGYWLGQAIVFTLTLFSLWYLLKTELKESFPNSKQINLVGFILPILFSISAISANLYRLGTAEVRQMLFVISFLIWMQKIVKGIGKKWIGILIFFLAIFSKETSIMLLPIYIIYLLPFVLSNYKKYKQLICSAFFFTFSSFIFYSIISGMKKLSSYSSSFSISFAQIKLNLLTSRLVASEIYYLIFILISLGLFRLYYFAIKNQVFSSKKENYIFKILLTFWQKNSFIVANLIGILSSFFFIFSWEHQLSRYYYPVYLFIIIYAVLEIAKSAKLFSKLTPKDKTKMALFPILVLFIAYFAFFQRTLPTLKNCLLPNKQLKDKWLSDYQKSYSIINALLKDNPDKVYTLIDDYEVVYELGLFANKLDFESNQLEVFSTNKEISKNHKYLLYSSDIKNDFLADESPNKILVTIEPRTIEFDTNLYQKQVIEINSLPAHLNNQHWIIWRKK